MQSRDWSRRPVPLAHCRFRLGPRARRIHAALRLSMQRAARRRPGRRLRVRVKGGARAPGRRRAQRVPSRTIRGSAMGAERSTYAWQVAGAFLVATATAGVALTEVLLRTDVEPQTPFMHDA
jgi:hypothetical protein